MSRLNKTQKYAIQWLNSKNYGIDQIANELNIDVKQIKSVLEKNTETSDKSNIKTTSSVAGDKKKNLMIMETSGKKNRSVAIMTKEASFKVDEMRNKSTSRNISKNIFKPKNQQ